MDLPCGNKPLLLKNQNTKDQTLLHNNKKYQILHQLINQKFINNLIPTTCSLTTTESNLPQIVYSIQFRPPEKMTALHETRNSLGSCHI